MFCQLNAICSFGYQATFFYGFPGQNAQVQSWASLKSVHDMVYGEGIVKIEGTG